MQAHILDREHTACVTQPAAGDDAPLLSFAGHIARPVSSAPLRVRVLWAAVVIMINPHHQPFPPRISSTSTPPFFVPSPPIHISPRLAIHTRHLLPGLGLGWTSDAFGCRVTVDLAASEPSGRP